MLPEMLVTLLIVVMVLIGAAYSLLGVYRLQQHSGARYAVSHDLRMAVSLIRADIQPAADAVLSHDSRDVGQRLVIHPIDSSWTISYYFRKPTPSADEVQLYRTHTGAAAPDLIASGLHEDSRFEPDGDSVKLYLVTLPNPQKGLNVPMSTATILFPQGSATP